MRPNFNTWSFRFDALLVIALQRSLILLPPGVRSLDGLLCRIDEDDGGVESGAIVKERRNRADDNVPL